MQQEEIFQKKLRDYAVKVDEFIEKILAGDQPLALYEASRYLIRTGGKRLRPYLVAKACEIVGGNANDAIPYAAGMEILHNFTLIHDDVMDKDDLRRGAPTVHVKYGIPLAITAGDLLFVKVYESLLKYSPKHLSVNDVLKSIQVVTEAATLLCEGQALDISYPKTADVIENDYIFMVGGKTSALFKACVEIGAIIGGANTEQLVALGKFAWDAGIAFQLVDDILGATANEETLGKPVGSDLKEGKKTLYVIHALSKISIEQRKILTKVLGNCDASIEDLKKAIKLLNETGSIDYTLGKADEYTKNALSQLDTFPDSESKNELKTLVEYFVRRDY
jgi:geranylgeranyl diphosphate synthase type I